LALAAGLSLKVMAISGYLTRAPSIGE